MSQNEDSSIFEAIDSIEKSEVATMASFTPLLKAELDFSTLVLRQYESAIVNIPAGTTKIFAVMLADSAHYFQAAIMSLLKGHKMHSMSFNRSAIEAVGYAKKIISLPTQPERQEREEIFNAREKEFEKYQSLFSYKNLFSDIPDLKSAYDLACYGSHPNTLNQRYRIVMGENTAKFGYLDDTGDPKENTKQYRRQANYTNAVHLDILTIYAEMAPEFLDNFNEWESQLIKIHSKYGDEFANNSFYRD